MSATSAATSRNATVRCVFCSTLSRDDLAWVDRHPRCGECGRPMLLRGVPTLIVFKQGREVAREVGAVPKPKLEELLAKAEAA